MFRILVAIGVSIIIVDEVRATPHDIVADSLVVLRVDGIDRTGRRVEGYGSGFVISTEGYVVTAAHVFEDLVKEGALEPTVKIYARLRDMTSPEISVERAGSSAADIMVLKLPRAAGGYRPLRLRCTYSRSEASKPIYTSGFHHACRKFSETTKTCAESQIVYTSGNGTVTSTEAVQHSVWATSLPFSGGNSGSPVYSADGVVVGVAKGTLQSGNQINYFTPITFARSLIGDLPIESACTALRDVPNDVATDDCVNSKLQGLTARRFQKSDMVRVGGTGARFDRRTETKEVCYQAPPGWFINGEVEVKPGEPNGGRGSVSPVQYSHSAERNGSSSACIVIRAWSEDKPFGGGGWQHVDLSGQIVKPRPDEQDLKQAAALCPAP